jgi:hypothetical protein
MENAPQQTFAEWLTDEMESLDVSPSMLAKATGQTGAAIYGWLAGLRPAGPSVAAVLKAMGSTDSECSRAWRAYHETVNRSKRTAS